MVKANQKDNNNNNGPNIKLSAPWSGQKKSFSNSANIPDDGASEIADTFVKERTRIHEVYIKENSRNKRIGLVLAFLLIIFSSGIVLFAPTGKESISYWIGTSLIIFAAGAVGFGRVWGKSESISFGADQDDRESGY
jgi:hypothetical protein